MKALNLKFYRSDNYDTHNVWGGAPSPPRWALIRTPEYCILHDLLTSILRTYIVHTYLLVRLSFLQYNISVVAFMASDLK